MRKKFFPGGNTSSGFINKFDNIVSKEEKGYFTYILKGGPGSGKNTIMKKLASIFGAEGYEIEEFRCASDPDSFDAVKIKGKNIVILDGTAPHVIDPKFPGVSDTIINLCCFKDKNSFKSKLDTLSKLSEESKIHYSSAYSYLKSIRTLKEDALKRNEKHLDIKLMDKLLDSLFEPIKEDIGDNADRQLFSKTYTPFGLVDFTETLIEGVKTYVIGGLSGYYFMKKAKEKLKYTDKLMLLDTIFPDVPMGIIIRSINTSLVWDINFEENHSFFTFDSIKDIRSLNKLCFELENNAIKEIEKSKKLHDEMEKIYKEQVDFSKINEITEKLIEEVLF